MHGGITLHSELGRGTKTKFWLPFQKDRIKAPHLGSADDSGMPFAARLDLSMPGRLDSKQDSHERSSRPPTSTSNYPMGNTQFQTTGEATVQSLSDTSKRAASSATEVDRKETRVLVVEDK